MAEPSFINRDSTFLEKDKKKEHIPVLLSSVLNICQQHFSQDYFREKRSLKFWDATFGLGGHSLALLENFVKAQIYASDHDQEILALSKKNFQEKFNNRVFFKKANFIENPFQEYAPFDLILLDLGISSLHYDFFERGFSFRYLQTLDMRMDLNLSLSATEWLNQADEKEICKILFTYGEEKRATKIAHKICSRRRENPIKTTQHLKEICESCYPKGFLYNGRSHADRYPAVRTFQAIRIFINKEIENLETVLNFLPNLLSTQGLLLIISFHSLEDKLVKKKFLEHSRILDNSPNARSYYKKGDFDVLQNKAIMATQEEVEKNPRSRSARMRGLIREVGF